MNILSAAGRRNDFETLPEDDPAVDPGTATVLR